MANSLLSSVRPYAVTLSVANLEELANWYVSKLGFVIVQRKSYLEFNTALVFLEKNGFRVELIKDGNAVSGIHRADPPAHTATHGVSQFAFETTDVVALKEELRERGVVAMIEAKDLADAQAAVDSLPLVNEGMLDNHLIPCTPYTGFDRLFAK